MPLQLEKLDNSTPESEYERIARDLLQFYSATRGFITGGSGIPDEFKAARTILEDFIRGDILHFNLPKKYQHEIEQVFREYIDANYPLWEKIPIKNTNKNDLNVHQRN